MLGVLQRRFRGEANTSPGARPNATLQVVGGNEPNLAGVDFPRPAFRFREPELLGLRFGKRIEAFEEVLGELRPPLDGEA